MMKKKGKIILRTAVLLFVYSITMFTIQKAFAIPANADATWKSIYREVLEHITKEGDQQNKWTWYTLWDMDRDAVPELIIKSGTSEADYEGVVYTIQNGIAIKKGSFEVWFASLYGDSTRNGLLLFNGYMGSYELWHHYYDNNTGFHSELLTEGNVDDTYPIYPDITDFVSEAKELTLVYTTNMLLLDKYETLIEYMNNNFPHSKIVRFPNDDENYYIKVIEQNLSVVPSRIGSAAGGKAHFQELLEKNYWGFNNLLEIRKIIYADLNGDGKMECILDLSEGDSEGIRKRFFLSEHDGIIRVYCDEYIDGDWTVDINGNLLCTYPNEFLGKPRLWRLIFNDSASFYQVLPLQFLKQ